MLLVLAFILRGLPGGGGGGGAWLLSNASRICKASGPPSQGLSALLRKIDNLLVEFYVIKLHTIIAESKAQKQQLNTSTR